MEPLKLIAGLGNPGSRYNGTRHNIGFDTVDLLAGKIDVRFDAEKFGAQFAQMLFEDKKLILLKPMDFMNNSGTSIAAVVNFYKIKLEDILVITDDLALSPGMLRLRPYGSAGGHNGLADIINKLGSDYFSRLRIGIGSAGLYETKDYVLAKPDSAQKAEIDRAMKTAVEAVMLWLEKGSQAVMNRYNTKMRPDAQAEGQ